MNFVGLEPIMANFQKCQSVISEKMKNVEHQFLSFRMTKHFAEQNKKITIIAEIINQRNNKLASYFRNRTSHPDIERILSKMENVFSIQNRDEQISDQRVQNSVNNIKRTPTRLEYLDNPQSTAQVPISGIKFQYTSLNEKENYEFHPAPQYGNIEAKFEFGSQNTKWSAHQIITCKINYFHMTPDNNSKFKHIPQLAPYLDTHDIESPKPWVFRCCDRKNNNEIVEINTISGQLGKRVFKEQNDLKGKDGYLLVLKLHSELKMSGIKNFVECCASVLGISYNSFEKKLGRAKKSKSVKNSTISSFQLPPKYQSDVNSLIAENKRNGHVELHDFYKKKSSWK